MSLLFLVVCVLPHHLFFGWCHLHFSFLVFISKLSISYGRVLAQLQDLERNSFIAPESSTLQELWS